MKDQSPMQPTIEPMGEPQRQAARAALDAFTRDSAGLTDVGADHAAAASLAYWQAQQRALDDAEAARLMADATAGSEAMRLAFIREFQVDFKRGVKWDLISGIVPAAALLVALWWASSTMHWVIQYRVVAAMVLAQLALAALVAWFVLRQPAARTPAPVTASFDTSVLAGSVGAIVVGALGVAGGGAFLSEQSKDSRGREAVALSAELRKVDAAVAMTLAARSVNAEPAHVSQLVHHATGLDWTVAPSGTGDASLLASARLHSGEARVRYLGESQSGQLATELFANGKPVALGRYVYGTVEPSVPQGLDGLRQVRLRAPGSAASAVFTLPRDTLAPPPGTSVVVREKSHGVIESLQSVDSVRSSLLIQRLIQAPPAAAEAAASGTGS